MRDHVPYIWGGSLAHIEAERSAEGERFHRPGD